MLLSMNSTMSFRGCFHVCKPILRNEDLTASCIFELLFQVGFDQRPHPEHPWDSREIHNHLFFLPTPFSFSPAAAALPPSWFPSQPISHSLSHFHCLCLCFSLSLSLLPSLRLSLSIYITVWLSFRIGVGMSSAWVILEHYGTVTRHIRQAHHENINCHVLIQKYLH